MVESGLFLFSFPFSLSLAISVRAAIHGALIHAHAHMTIHAHAKLHIRLSASFSLSLSLFPSPFLSTSHRHRHLCPLLFLAPLELPLLFSFLTLQTRKNECCLAVERKLETFYPFKPFFLGEGGRHTSFQSSSRDFFSFLLMLVILRMSSLLEQSQWAPGANEFEMFFQKQNKKLWDESSQTFSRARARSSPPPPPPPCLLLVSICATGLDVVDCGNFWRFFLGHACRKKLFTLKKSLLLSSPIFGPEIRSPQFEVA